MHPDPYNLNQPGRPAPSPDPHTLQPLPQYPSPYPPSMGQQAWQQGPAQTVDTTPQLPPPQLPSPVVPSAAPNTNPTPPHQLQNPAAVPTSRVPRPSQKKMTFIAALAIGILLVLGGAAYFLLKGNGPADRTAPAGANTQQEKNITSALTSLEDLTLLPPANLSRYQANTANTELTMAYNTEGDACSLQLGVVDEATLPGKDMQDIVARQIQALQNQGVLVEGPLAGQTLTLKDVSKPNVHYSVATMVFVATDSANKQVRSHYSAAVLKSGKRAYIMRTCQVAGGSVDEKAVRPLDDDAKHITVRVK